MNNKNQNAGKFISLELNKKNTEQIAPIHLLSANIWSKCGGIEWKKNEQNNWNDTPGGPFELASLLATHLIKKKMTQERETHL